MVFGNSELMNALFVLKSTEVGRQKIFNKVSNKLVRGNGVVNYAKYSTISGRRCKTIIVEVIICISCKDKRCARAT